MTGTSPTTERLETCPDCGVTPGEPHLVGCDVERCAACGGQRISCGCGRRSDVRRRERVPWTGLWPGVADCQRLGWYCKRAEVGYVTCDKDDPDATEDLNRLARETTWNPVTRRYEAREPRR